MPDVFSVFLFLSNNINLTVKTTAWKLNSNSINLLAFVCCFRTPGTIAAAEITLIWTRNSRPGGKLIRCWRFQVNCFLQPEGQFQPHITSHIKPPLIITIIIVKKKQHWKILDQKKISLTPLHLLNWWSYY